MRPKAVVLASVFPRLAPVPVFATSSDWLIVLFTSIVIGQSDYFGYGVTKFS